MLVFVEREKGVFYMTEVTVSIDVEGLFNEKVLNQITDAALVQFIGKKGALVLVKTSQLVITSAEEMIEFINDYEKNIYYVTFDGNVYLDNGFSIRNEKEMKVVKHDFETFVREFLYGV